MRVHRGRFSLTEDRTGRRRSYCGHYLSIEDAPTHDEAPWTQVDCKTCRRGVRPAVLRGEE